MKRNAKFGMGRYGSVGMATCYWLDGPGIESRWGRNFPRPSRPALEPTQPPIRLVVMGIVYELVSRAGK
jgi:hypothetical protein